MNGHWIEEIESLEEISQNPQARAIFLRLAELRRHGRVHTFLAELEGDPEVDDDVKGPLVELAQDADFLRAIEDYVHKTSLAH
jgi:hypothetical protein